MCTKRYLGVSLQRIIHSSAPEQHSHLGKAVMGREADTEISEDIRSPEILAIERLLEGKFRAWYYLESIKGPFSEPRGG